MPRYKPKYKAGLHAKKRFKERYEGGTQDAEMLALRGLHYGIHFSQIPDWSPLREFVEKKKNAFGKKVRLLDGYVLIYSNNKRLLTLYKLPEEFQKHYDDLKPILDENKAWYKSVRSGSRQK